MSEFLKVTEDYTKSIILLRIGNIRSIKAYLDAKGVENGSRIELCHTYGEDNDVEEYHVVESFEDIQTALYSRITTV